MKIELKNDGTWCDFVEKFFLRLIVEQRKGVMARIATLLARKGYIIGSICVGKHLEDGEASIVLTVRGEEAEVKNAKDLLGKLIHVISIEMYHESDAVERELCLLKVEKGEDLKAKLSGFDFKVVKEGKDFVVVEIIDYPARIEELVALARKNFKVLDISRSGANAI